MLYFPIFPAQFANCLVLSSPLKECSAVGKLKTAKISAEQLFKLVMNWDCPQGKVRMNKLPMQQPVWAANQSWALAVFFHFFTIEK